MAALHPLNRGDMSVRGKEHLKVLLRRSAIQKRVQEIGKQITEDYRGQRVHLIGVLKGASIFLADLVRTVGLEVSLDFMAVSSYGKRHAHFGRSETFQRSGHEHRGTERNSR